MVKKVSNSNERLRELMEILNLKQSDILTLPMPKGRGFLVAAESVSAD